MSSAVVLGLLGAVLVLWVSELVPLFVTSLTIPVVLAMAEVGTAAEVLEMRGASAFRYIARQNLAVLCLLVAGVLSFGIITAVVLIFNGALLGIEVAVAVWTGVSLVYLLARFGIRLIFVAPSALKMPAQITEELRQMGADISETKIGRAHV